MGKEKYRAEKENAETEKKWMIELEKRNEEIKRLNELIKEKDSLNRKLKITIEKQVRDKVKYDDLARQSDEAAQLSLMKVIIITTYAHTTYIHPYIRVHTHTHVHIFHVFPYLISFSQYHIMHFTRSNHRKKK